MRIADVMEKVQVRLTKAEIPGGLKADLNELIELMLDEKVPLGVKLLILAAFIAFLANAAASVGMVHNTLLRVRRKREQCTSH